jgi:hypothetical protein
MSKGHHSISRRDFLAMVPTAAAFLAAHDLLADTPPVTTAPAETSNKKGQHRIHGLRLLTAAPLTEMREFYHKKLGFRIVSESKSEITFASGATSLTFAKAEPAQIKGDGGRGRGEPMYHFVFNIPENKLRAARAWLLERTALIDPRPENRDPEFPADVWHFRHWNAHSLFFWDPAYNIVEFIARHTLKSDAKDADRFDSSDILYASEIGFVFEPGKHDVGVRMLQEKLGLHEYPRGADPWAMGDEHGLLLCLGRKGQQWGDNTTTPVKWDVFSTDAIIAGNKREMFEFDGFPYRVKVL